MSKKRKTSAKQRKISSSFILNLLFQKLLNKCFIKLSKAVLKQKRYFKKWQKIREHSKAQKWSFINFYSWDSREINQSYIFPTLMLELVRKVFSFLEQKHIGRFEMKSTKLAECFRNLCYQILKRFKWKLKNI